MHRLGVRQSSDIAVIHEEMLLSLTISGADPQNHSAIDTDTQQINFGKLKVLYLSFQKIAKVDNLQPCANLIKLQLDNNVIREIEGIDHLIHLEWLDLSFNLIEQIKGLEMLVNLTDLSLFNNSISKLENLENLKQLQIFSIGNNLLPTTEGLVYLKHLPSLKVLNLSGNPVCTDPEYRTFVLAHFDTLEYLDHELIEESDLALAREQYQDERDEMRELRAIEEAALLREKEEKAYERMLRDANVAILETLVKDMYKADMDMDRLEALPGLSNIRDEFIEKASAATETVKQLLVEKHASLSQSLNTYAMKHEQWNIDAQQKSIMCCENHRITVKKLTRQVQNSMHLLQHQDSASSSIDHASISSKILEIILEIEKEGEKLHLDLMEIESMFVEAVQDLISTLEVSVESIRSESQNAAVEHFRTIEELENVLFESIGQLVISLYERLADADPEDEDYISEECHAILNDREGLSNAITASHDVRIGKLIVQEDLHREQNIAKTDLLIKERNEEEWERNRQRVLEIIHIRESNIAASAQLRQQVSQLEEEYN